MIPGFAENVSSREPPINCEKQALRVFPAETWLTVYRRRPVLGRARGRVKNVQKPFEGRAPGDPGVRERSSRQDVKARKPKWLVELVSVSCKRKSNTEAGKSSKPGWADKVSNFSSRMKKTQTSCH